jgi:hypothetical protein
MDEVIIRSKNNEKKVVFSFFADPHTSVYNLLINICLMSGLLFVV